MFTNHFKTLHHQCQKDFFWEYNARAIYKGYKILEIGINHKKRKFGDTQIFHVWRLPKIALINFIGLLRVKFDLLIN